MNKMNKYTRGSRWHSRGRRFDPAYFHPENLKSAGLFILLHLVKKSRNTWFPKSFTHQILCQNYDDTLWTEDNKKEPDSVGATNILRGLAAKIEFGSNISWPGGNVNRQGFILD